MSTNDHLPPCCPQWEELGSWIDAALTHYQLSGGKPPDISFTFCPWCGVKRGRPPEQITDTPP